MFDSTVMSINNDFFTNRISKKIIIFLLIVILLFTVRMVGGVISYHMPHTVESISHIMTHSPHAIKDGVVHEVSAAVICNRTLFITVLLYKEGETAQLSSVTLLGDIHYSIYDNNMRSLNLSSSAGNIMHLEVRLHTPPKKSTEVFHIYLDNTELFVLELIDTQTAKSIIKPLTNNINNVKVMTFSRCNNNQLEIFIWLEEAPSYQFDFKKKYIATKSGQWLGYSESDVYLVNEFGVTQSRKSDDACFRLFQSYHYYFFELDDESGMYTLIIPSITYINTAGDEIDVEGPFTFALEV